MSNHDSAAFIMIFRMKSNIGQYSKKTILEEQSELIIKAIELLSDVLSLCSPRGAITVLPTVLLLLTGILREMTKVDDVVANISVTVTTKALQVS